MCVICSTLLCDGADEHWLNPWWDTPWYPGRQIHPSHPPPRPTRSQLVPLHLVLSVTTSGGTRQQQQQPEPPAWIPACSLLTTARLTESDSVGSGQWDTHENKHLLGFFRPVYKFPLLPSLSLFSIPQKWQLVWDWSRSIYLNRALNSPAKWLLICGAAWMGPQDLSSCKPNRLKGVQLQVPTGLCFSCWVDWAPCSI